jgi:hypothetical protein
MPRCWSIAVVLTLRVMKCFTPKIGRGGRSVMTTLVLAAMLGGRAMAVWQEGDFRTHSQEDWGEHVGYPVPALLQARSSEVYAATFGILEVGIIGPGGYSMLFTGATEVQTYLPAPGDYGPLTMDLVNPATSMAEEFGGEMVALSLNIDFADAGYISGNLDVPFGDLEFHGLTSPVWLNGKSVRQFRDEASTILGGGAGNFSVLEASNLAEAVNDLFTVGGITSFAQNHLRLPEFVTGDFTTHTQASWGEQPGSGSNVATLLEAHYSALYAGAGFEVGTPGPFGNSMLFYGFLGAGPLQNYLPASGPAGPLGADYVNPLTTNAGEFGGEMAALKLNIDFADEGLLGTLGVAFGDLVFHDLAPIIQGGYNYNFNGFTVRDFFDVANGWLGFDGDVGLVPHFNLLAEQLNAAFAAGAPSPWALDHLQVDLLGDFNHDNTVSAADYVAWRKGAGVAPTPVNHHRWQNNFGQPASSGSDAAANTTVPEPGTLVLLIVAAAGAATPRRYDAW